MDNTTRYLYDSYGLRLISDRELEILGMSPSVASADQPGSDQASLHIFQRTPLPGFIQSIHWQPYKPLQTREGGYRAWCAPGREGQPGDFVRLDFARNGSACSFYLQSQGEACWVTYEPGPYSDQEMWLTVQALLLGRVMNVLLTLRGFISLHGSGLLLNGQAIVFLGESKSGKSSLAAELVRHGCSILADDRLVLTWENGRILVQPGGPRLRLWQDTLAHLQIQSERLARVMVFEEKRYLEAESPALPKPRAATPLGAIYILGPRLAPDAACQAERMTPASGLFWLLKNRNGFRLLSHAQISQDAQKLAQVASNIPIFRLSRPDNLEALPEVVEYIIANEKARASLG